MSESQGPVDPNSIYRAPESDPSVAPVGDQLSAFVGPKYAEYYAGKFENFERGGSASWNWPAFFIASLWLLYRKMWAYALSYWFLLPMVLAFVAGVVSAGQADTMSALITFNAVYYGCWTILTLILFPMFANRLYFRHAKKKMAKIALRFPDREQQSLELARAGGTSNVVIVVLPIVVIALIGILAAIAIPAYQDYTIRAQVSEGLSLSAGAKAAVAEYYLDVGDVPADNATAGLEQHDRIVGKYVLSVQVQSGDLVVTYGRGAHNIISGKTLTLGLVPEGDGRSSWRCYSDDIADKHLPAACR